MVRVRAGPWHRDKPVRIWVRKWVRKWRGLLLLGCSTDTSKRTLQAEKFNLELIFSFPAASLSLPQLATTPFVFLFQ